MGYVVTFTVLLIFNYLLDWNKELSFWFQGCVGSKLFLVIGSLAISVISSRP